MAQQQGMTLWQKLERYVSGNAEYAEYTIDQNFAKNIDPSEYEQEKLQAQQTAYLQSQWKSIDNELYQKAVFYEPTRIASYYDYESMEYCIAGDSGVPTPDGMIKIEDLAAKGRNHEFITYAYDFNKEKLVPTKAYNVHKTRDEFTYKITFDDDSYIIATPDHMFLKRNGQFERTKNLQPGDSMMPFYRKSFFNNQNYNWVYTCNSKEGHHGWVPEHTLVAEEFDRPLQENEEVHHKDFNGKNNDPSNLQIMNKSEHRAYHARLNNEKLWADPEYREKMKRVARSPKNFSWDGQRKGSGNPSYIEIAKKENKIKNAAKLLNVSHRKIQNEIKLHGFKNWKDFLNYHNIQEFKTNSEQKQQMNYNNIPWDNIIEAAKKCEKLEQTASYLNITKGKLESQLRKHNFNWTTFCKAYGIKSHNKEGRGVLNHKIKSIEPYGVIPVYDLTVPGHKNFATDTIISHNTPEISAALDIYSEEATTPDEHGRMLQIYSESEKIKDELEDLFYNRLDVNANLPPWIRNVPIRKNSIIPLLDGTEDEIQNIATRIKNGEEVWTYSVQNGTKEIKPGKIVWCDLTRKNSPIVRVTLDDDTHIDSTPDHEFMLRDGSYKRADELEENDSLMPFYTYESKYNKNLINGYEKVYNPRYNRHKYTHRVVANDCIRDHNYENQFNDYFLTHHIDFNKLNNHPSNLQRMTFSDHSKLHEKYAEYGKKILQRQDIKEKRYEALQKYLRSDYRRKQQSKKYEGHYPEDFKKYNNSKEHSKHNHIRKKTTQSIWNDVEKRKEREESMRIKFDDYVWDEIDKAIEGGDIKLRKDIVSYINNNLIDHILSINKNRRLHNKGKISERIFLERIKEHGYNTPKEYLDTKKELVLNHKVKSVDFITETDDVYCMEVHGPNGEKDRHNFPVCGKDINGNYKREGTIVANCKYGDNFVYLKMFPKKGIVDVSQLPNMEITRVEPDFQKITKLNSFEQEQNIQFQWRNKDLHFNSFEIAHFRLLGDDRRLPYGTCCVSGTYVNTSFGSRKIEEVNIGDNIKYFDKDKQEFNVSKVKDIVCNGQKPYYYVKTRHNYMNLTGNHVVITYNPDTNKFEDKFTSDLQNGDYLIIQPNEPNGKDISIDKSIPEDYDKSQNYSEKNRYWNNIDSLIPDYVDEDFARLFGYLMGDGSLDKNNNTISICLSEHKEINKRYIELAERFSGRKDNVINEENYGKNYRVYSKMLMTILERMGFSGNAYTKEIPYWLFDAKPEIQKAFVDGIIDADGSMHIDKWDCCRYEIELANEQLIKGLKHLIQQIGWKSGKIKSRQRNNIVIKGNEVKDAKTTYSFYFWKKELTNYEKDYTKIQTNNYIIEKIEDIKYNENPEYVYDIYVENENHNFVANGVVVHNSVLEKARRIWKQLMLAEDAMMVYRTSRAPERRIYKVYVGNMDDKDVNNYVDKIANEFKRSQVTDASTGNMDTRYNQLAVDQDYFIPVRDPNQASPIETLPGAENLSEIADIQYIQRKLFTALRVPKTFLGFDEPEGEGKNLALMDIRFSRAIHRVQKSIVQELNKIAIIHLYLKGYKDDLENFSLGLTSPSTQADLLQLEGWQQKMDIYKSAVEKVNQGMSAMSATKAKKEILGMSDEEIRVDLQRQAVEEAANEEMTAISETVTQTGVFKQLYDIYGITPEDLTGETEESEEGATGGASAPMSAAGGEIPEGGEEGEEEPEEGGEEGGEEGEEEGEEELAENKRRSKKRIKEKFKKGNKKQIKELNIRKVQEEEQKDINVEEINSQSQHKINNMLNEIDNLFNNNNKNDNKNDKQIINENDQE